MARLKFINVIMVYIISCIIFSIYFQKAEWIENTAKPLTIDCISLLFCPKDRFSI